MKLELYGHLANKDPNPKMLLALSQTVEFDIDTIKLSTRWLDQDYLPDVSKLKDETRVSEKLILFFERYGQKLYKYMDLDTFKRIILIYLEFDNFIKIKKGKIQAKRKLPKFNEDLCKLVAISSIVYGMFWYYFQHIKDGKLMIPMTYVQEKTYIEIMQNPSILF